MKQAELSAIVAGIAPALKNEITATTQTLIAEFLVRHHIERLPMMAERLAASEATIGELQKEIGQLNARLVAAETMAAVVVPGPAGAPGKDGLPGQDGAPGKDGAPGLRYLGVFVQGQEYAPGDVTTYAGSAWHCNEATTAKPGDGATGWQLMVKRGRDGRDGKA